MNKLIRTGLLILLAVSMLLTTATAGENISVRTLCFVRKISSLLKRRNYARPKSGPHKSCRAQWKRNTVSHC